MISKLRQKFEDRLKQGDLKEAGIAFAIRVSSALLAYLVQVLLARMMELEDYGIYAAMWTWLLVVSHITVFGFSESSLRFLPRYRARGRMACAQGFLNTGFIAVTVCATVLTAAGLLLTQFVIPGVSPQYMAPLTIVAIGLPFATLELYLLGVARAFGWFRLAIVPPYLIRPVLIGVGVFAAAKAGVEANAANVLSIAIAITAANTIGQALIIYRRVRRETGKLAGTNRSGLWLRASLPLIFVYGIEEIFVSSDILMLGFLSSPDQVAIYFAAVRCMAIANFVHFAFMLVASRNFSIANAGQDKSELQRQVSKVSKWTFWLTVPAIAVTLALGYPLLLLFSPEFTAGYTVMVILGLGYLARASVGQAGDLLVVLGYQRESLWIAAGSLMLNIVLTVIFVPMLGIAGAALSTSLSLAFRALTIAVVARQKAGLEVFALKLPTAGDNRIPAPPISATPQ